MDGGRRRRRFPMAAGGGGTCTRPAGRSSTCLLASSTPGGTRRRTCRRPSWCCARCSSVGAPSRRRRLEGRRGRQLDGPRHQHLRREAREDGWNPSLLHPADLVALLEMCPRVLCGEDTVAGAPAAGRARDRMGGLVLIFNMHPDPLRMRPVRLPGADHPAAERERPRTRRHEHCACGPGAAS